MAGFLGRFKTGQVLRAPCVGAAVLYYFLHVNWYERRFATYISPITRMSRCLSVVLDIKRPCICSLKVYVEYMMRQL